MRGGLGRLLIFLFMIYSIKPLAQEVKVNGGFVEDSLLIGQDVNFWITASYPAQMEMVFPDSSFDFSPFEYSSKLFIPTALENNMAKDSTVYTVQSFEIDLVQYLQLPTFILNGEDTSIVQTPIDSIYLTELAPMASDTTQLITNTEYSEVDRAFNFPLMYIIIGVFLLIVIVLLAIFGSKIIRYFKLRKLRKDYEKFSEKLSNYISKLKTNPESELAETALFYWKRYQEKLDKYPFTKSTTKEILSEAFAKELEKPLKSIDRLIYGKRPTDTVFQDFQQIEDFTQYRYNKKVEEIRDGK